MATGTANPMAPPKVPLPVSPGASVNTRAAASITMVASPSAAAVAPGDMERSPADFLGAVITAFMRPPPLLVLVLRYAALLL